MTPFRRCTSLLLACCSTAFLPAIARAQVDPYKGLPIQAFSNGGSLTVAYHTNAGIKVGDYTFNGSQWQANRQIDISRSQGALDIAAGVTTSPGGDIYVLTTAQEDISKRPVTSAGSHGNRPNLVKLLQISAGTNNATLFADLNASNTYIPGDWNLSTPLTRGKARMTFAQNTIGLSFSHWWDPDGIKPDADGVHRGHQRSTRLAITPDTKQPIFQDTKNPGPNWHNFDTAVLVAGDYLFSAETTEAGVALKRYLLKAKNADDAVGMEVNRMVYYASAAPGFNAQEPAVKGNGHTIQLAGLTGCAIAVDKCTANVDSVTLAFIYNNELITLNVKSQFPDYTGENNYYSLLESGSIKRTWGTAGKLKKNARLVALNDKESMLLWEEWAVKNGEAQYEKTMAARITNNSSSNNAAMQIDSPDAAVRLEHSSDAFLMKATNGETYVTWVTKAPDQEEVHLHMVKDNPTTKTLGSAMSLVLGSGEKLTQVAVAPDVQVFRGENLTESLTQLPADQRFVHVRFPDSSYDLTLTKPDGSTANNFTRTNPNEYVVHIHDYPQLKRQGTYTVNIQKNGTTLKTQTFSIGDPSYDWRSLPKVEFFRGEELDQARTSFAAEQRFVHARPLDPSYYLRLTKPNGTVADNFEQIVTKDYVVHIHDYPENERQGTYTVEVFESKGGSLLDTLTFTLGN